jgi:hypothetical protein
MMEQLNFARVVDHKICDVGGAQPCEPRSCHTGVCAPMNSSELRQGVPLVELSKHILPLRGRDHRGI